MPNLIKDLYYNIDLFKNAIYNAKLNPITNTERLALSLSISDVGYIAYDSTSKDLYVWTGIAWKITGVDTFLKLDDTPNTYTGATEQILRINSGETAIEFHTLVKADIGLGNVDNTSDINKPISAATQVAIDDIVSGLTGSFVSRLVDDTKFGNLTFVQGENSNEVAINNSTITLLNVDDNYRNILTKSLITLNGASDFGNLNDSITTLSPLALNISDIDSDGAVSMNVKSNLLEIIGTQGSVKFKTTTADTHLIVSSFIDEIDSSIITVENTFTGAFTKISGDSYITLSNLSSGTKSILNDINLRIDDVTTSTYNEVNVGSMNIIDAINGGSAQFHAGGVSILTTVAHGSPQISLQTSGSADAASLTNLGLNLNDGVGNLTQISTSSIAIFSPTDSVTITPGSIVINSLDDTILIGSAQLGYSGLLGRTFLRFIAPSSGDKIQFIQDAAGTIALLSDITAATDLETLDSVVSRGSSTERDIALLNNAVYKAWNGDFSQSTQMDGGTGIVISGIDSTIYGNTYISWTKSSIGNTLNFPTTTAPRTINFPDATGTVVLTSTIQSYGDTQWVQLDGSYTDPSWITSLSWSKITGVSVGSPLYYNSGILYISQSYTSGDGYLSSSDWNIFNNKEASLGSGTTSQYLRGDKSWRTLNTSVVPESGNLYFTIGRVDTQVATYTGDVTLSGSVFSIGSSTITNTMLVGSITNAKLVNSSITLGSTSISLGATSTSLAGLTSITSTAFIGDLTGNATTATMWATGRTVSGTGEATFITGSLDGSANVSGVVTLTNSAVINKVLTGYVSGVGTVAATDNILQAIQKLNGNIGALVTGVSSFNSRVGVVIPVAGDYSALTETLTNKSGNISQWTNNSGYITAATAASTYVPYTGASSSVNIGAHDFTTTTNIFGGAITITGNSTFANIIASISGLRGPAIYYTNGIYEVQLQADTLTTTRVIQLPNANGTLALVGDLSSYISQEIPSGTINGSNVTFTLANTPINANNSISTLHLYQNGRLLKITDDYTRSGTTITMITAPLTSDTLLATYYK